MKAESREGESGKTDEGAMLATDETLIKHGLQKGPRSVVQDWVCYLPMMQQTVLFTAIRGPDGLPKYGCVKMLLRWYRRCVLLSAMDGHAIEGPQYSGGGSFTGPSFPEGEMHGSGWEYNMDAIVSEYLRTLDAIPHHFQLHLLHAVEILGYKFPVLYVRVWWHQVYLRLVHDMHLNAETEEQMESRLGDSREGWLKRADPATVE